MLDPEDTLDPELAALYATERAVPLPDGATARVLAGVLAGITASTIATGAASAAVGATGAAGTGATSSGATAAGTGATAVTGASSPTAATAISAAGGASATGIAVGKVVAIAVVSAIGGGAVGVVSYRELASPPAVRETAPPREPTPRPDLVAPAAVVDAPPVVDAPSVSDAPTASADASPTRPTTKRDPVDPGADTREPLLIDQARAALRRGLVDQAVETLMRHERLHPKGDLAEERDVLIIEAYVAKGDATLAKRRIERYRRDHPGGFLRARVDRAEAGLAGP